LEKPAIFKLIENYHNNKQDLIDELNIYKNFVFNLYFKKFNILTYSSLFVNDSLQCIVNFFDKKQDLSFHFDLNGYNALHTSCMHGIIYNTKFLLENNFCSNLLSRNLKTPTILAIESNSNNIKQLLSLLKHYGANLNFSINSKSPIEIAVKLKNINVINFLINGNVYIHDNIKQQLIKDSNLYTKRLIKTQKKKILKKLEKYSEKKEEFDLLKEFYKHSVISNKKESANFFHKKLLFYKLQNF
jgi:ankyrin repeat protein